MKRLLFFGAIVFVAGCVQKYDAPVHSPVTGYLVVDGFANSGSGGTTIKLSRTAKLDSTNIQFERGATVQLEGQDNSTYPLLEGDSGHYNTSNLNLNSSIKYRLNITTGDGKQYQSDYTIVKNNPPIDSISWASSNDGVQTYINTHDPLDTTRYYQWDYVETWEYQSPYQSELKYQVTLSGGDEIYTCVYRDASDPPLYTTCYQSDASTSILIGTSEKLSKDVINLPLALVPSASWKLSVLYSIDVKQYSLTKDAYEFLERMKKNTEEVGSIFDAQPSELNGNIHCITNPAETVVGYFTICPLQEKRLFINNNQVPNWNYSTGCVEVEVVNQTDSIKNAGAGLTPTTIVKGNFLMPIMVFDAAPPACVNCELLGGSHIKPTFWP